jgi:hypothetical protein
MLDVPLWVVLWPAVLGWLWVELGCDIWSGVLCCVDVPPLLGLLEDVDCARANPAHSSRNVVDRTKFFIYPNPPVLFLRCY